MPSVNAEVMTEDDNLQELRKNLQFMRIFMRTGLTKKQKVTEVYYNAKDPTAEAIPTIPG